MNIDPSKTATRILRHKATRAYFAQNGWTQDPREARNFPDVLDAARACVENELIDVELVVRLQPDSSDVFRTWLR